MPGPRDLLNRYKLRLRRKRLLWRAVRKRHEFKCIERKTGSIKANNILLFACLRNEMLRLPFFLAHYRRLGVDQFLLVDNGSDDGSVAFLQDQPDVSLWSANAGYKAARFGMDWLTALQWKHGSGHWCLTVDIDELLIYPDWHDKAPNFVAGSLKRHSRDFVTRHCSPPNGATNKKIGKNPYKASNKDEEAPSRQAPSKQAPAEQAPSQSNPIQAN